MLKLPLFVAILVILEEILPLVVIYLPSLLPSTCILPSQLETIHSATELKRHRVISDLQAPESEVAKVSGAGSDLGDVLSQLSSQALSQLATVYNLATWGTQGMLRSRIASHLRYLRDDDGLMSEGRGFNSVPQDKVGLVKACSERGLRAVGLPHAEQVQRE